MKWKVISFFTEDYKDEVAILIKSLNAFKISYDIEGVKDRGSWKKNAFYKIPFIVKKLKQYNHPLVWLDADAEVIQYPSLFDELESTLMAGIYSPLKKREYVSNTIYFVPSVEVSGYLKEVEKFIKEVPNAYNRNLVGEQLYMQKVLEANNWKERLNFKELPYSYGMPSYWKECAYSHLYKEPFVIKQRQASRRKDFIKKKYYESLGLSLVD